MDIKMKRASRLLAGGIAVVLVAHAAGAQGPAGVVDVQYNNEKHYLLPPGSGFGVGADCPVGTRPIGGGWQTNTISGTALHVAGSFPQYYPDNDPAYTLSRWVVTVNNTGGTYADIWVYAICTP